MSLSSNDQLEFKLLTRDKVQEALDIQTETMKQECLAIGFGMFEEAGAAEEMRLVFTELIKDGATIIAVDRETNQLAAVAFNKIHASCLAFLSTFFNFFYFYMKNFFLHLKARPREGVKDSFEIFMEENLKHRACQELVKFLGNVSISQLLAELLRLYKLSLPVCHTEYI